MESFKNPIKKLYKQIKDRQLYASCGNIPFSDLQLVNIACNIITDTGVMTKAYKDWVKQSIQNQTWYNFKAHSSKAYSEYEEFD